MSGCTDNIVHGCIRWTKKFLVTNILPILTYFIIMASAAARVIEFRHVLKFFYYFHIWGHTRKQVFWQDGVS